MQMQTYFGSKLIHAAPMTRGEYNALRGWEVPDDENPDDPGYLVEYTDGGKANHPSFAGYISWSPADVFTRAYSPLGGLDFGDAIRALKCGYRVARTGWNGKGMWLALSGMDGVRETPASQIWSHHVRNHAVERGGIAEILPTVVMKTADDKILMGWLASQTDMLASDWVVLED